LVSEGNDKVDSKQVKDVISWKRRTDQKGKDENGEELKIMNTRVDFYEELELCVASIQTVGCE
jgi:hypothetical protein